MDIAAGPGPWGEVRRVGVRRVEGRRGQGGGQQWGTTTAGGSRRQDTPEAWAGLRGGAGAAPSVPQSLVAVAPRSLQSEVSEK